MASAIHSNLRNAGGRRLSSLLVLALLLLAAPSAFGQGTSATVRGVVKDPSGAVVPGATVVLTSTQRGDRREAKTNEEGTYVFTSVDPGPYTLRVEATGFRASESAVTLAPSETRGLDIAVEVGGAAETVSVTAEEAPIKTETGEKSETITAKQIDNLSIIGRSSLELLRILPGVVGPEQSALESTGFNQGGNASASYAVNGIRGVNNQISIDGSRVVDIGSNNGTIITPNNDMVQEVTIKTSNYAAEYGSSGVQITATTKGGGRDFHGELYHYTRPRALAANDRSNTTVGAPRPQSSFNYPGGNVGGPVILPFTNFNRDRDRLFFWAGFEVQRQRVDPGTRLAIVPTARERAGDFSQSASSYGDLCTPESFAFACTPIPDRNLAPFADPIGSRLLSLYPLPNFSAPAGSPQSRFNYASSVISPVNRTDLKMRFDYNITNSTKMYVRLARESETQDFAYGLWWGPSQYELPSHVIGSNLGRSAAANITTVINPTMTNEVVISASKLKLDNDYADPSKVTRAGLGIENFRTPFGGNANSYGPLAIIGNWDAATQLWEPGNLPLFAHNDSYSATDTVSKIYNNHTFKFGGLIEQANKIQNQSGSPEGLLVVNGNNFGQPRGTGNLFGNLFTGRLEQFQQSTVVPVGKFRFWNFEGFAQDSWKVRPNFTLEYGARVSFFPNNYERGGLAVTFDPSRYVRNAGPYIDGDPTRPNGYLLASRGEIPKGVVDNPPPQFAPRLNFAWDIFGDASTVLRGGAGIFYNRVQGNYQYDILTQPPNTLNVAVNAWSAPDQDLTLSNIGNINPLTFPGTTNVTVQELNSYRLPRITTASMSVARRLPMENVLEVSYVGTFGRHLPQRRNVNFYQQRTTGTIGNADLSNPLHRAALSDPAVRTFQPFPDYGEVNFYEFVGTSNYHSLQATLNRQLGRRFQYFATYTFSKALGTTSVDESSGSDQVDPVDIRGRSYGILSFDRTHIFNLSYNWNLPDLARGDMRNWFTKGLLNGWQMSGITTLESGRPIRLRFTGAITSAATLRSYFGTNAFTNSSGNAGGIAPVLLSNPQTGGGDVGDRFLDLGAVGIPAFGQSGPYQSPFYIRSPRRSNFDVTFFKNFNISETKRFQFRTGLFNIFNQAYANPALGDINLRLDTECVAQAPAGIPRGLAQDGSDVTTAPICDPTQGFRFTQQTINEFGQVINKHGHRRVELAFKFYF